jgi:uncharacterized protein YkwD
MARKLLTAALAFGLLMLLAPTGAAAASRLIAPPSACPDQTVLGAPAAAQEETMLCMTNYAREQYGEPPLEPNGDLERSARDKARDVISCDEFSHYACGREFTYWMRSTGYLSAKCWRAGENLAYGVASYGSVGSIFRAWMRSPTHRENLLGNFDQIGIDLMVGRLDGRGGTRIWAQHFGSHCGDPSSA